MSRIAILSSGFPPTGGGGVASAHFNLYQALRSLEHEVRVFTFADDARAPVPPGAAVSRAGRPPRPVVDGLERLVRLFVLRSRRQQTRRTRHVIVCALSARRAFPGIRRFAPEVLIVPDHGAPSALLPKLPGCTVVFVSHHNTARFTSDPLLGAFSAEDRDARLALRAEQRAVAGADVAVCPSHYMRDVFRRTYTFDGPVEVIPNLIDQAFLDTVSAADLRREYGLGASALIVYIPSAGNTIKGERFTFEIVRRLAARHPGEIAFFLSGLIQPPLRRELEFLPKNARVIAPGRIPYEANVSHVKACDLCVSPTLLENFSMGFLEAQACGLPVVSFAVGGNPDVVADGETGYLVPFLDLEALIERAAGLVADAGLRRTLGEAARTRARTEFDPQALARRYVEAATGKGSGREPRPDGGDA